MQVIGQGLARLRGIEHDFLFSLIIGANERTTATGGNHLVAVEAHDAIIAEGAAQLATITGTKGFGRIFDHRNLVAAGNLHDVIDSCGHTVEIYRDDGLGLATRLGDAVFDGILQQIGINIPCIGLTIDKDRDTALISHGVGTGRECHRLTDHLVVTTNAQLDKRQMNSRRSRAECDNTFSLAAQLLKVFFKSINVRSQRNYPVGVKSLLDIFHFLAAHVSQTKQNLIVSHIS